MLKTDPAEVTVPFQISCVFEDARGGHGGKAGGDTCLHREMIVLTSKIVLQTRCDNTYNNSDFWEKKPKTTNKKPQTTRTQIRKYFSYLPLKKKS